jgi:hypothetical protein
LCDIEVVVGDQMAADLERLLIDRLGLSELPPGEKAEPQVVVKDRRVEVEIAEHSAVDLKSLLE